MQIINNLKSVFTVKTMAILCALIGFAGCANSQTQNESQHQSPVEAGTFTDINVNECAKMMSQKDVVLLDVRTPEETSEGIIEGALTIDFYGDQFEQEVLKLDRDKTYIVYCKSGGRSSSASEMMSKAGFKNVHNLEGGYTEWSKANPDE